MRLPGSCAAGLTDCLQPEQVQTPFQVFNVSWQPLVWSPDGSMAVLPVATVENGYPATVYLYEPQSESWAELAHFNFVDGSMWSANGDWIALRVQDGLGNVDIYVVRPDGSGLRNLTGANFPNKGESTYLSMDGWLDNDAIIATRGLAEQKTLFYRVDPVTGEVYKLWEYPTYSSGLFSGPNGKLAVVHSLSPRGQVLELLNEEGRVLNTVATFVSGRIYQVVWSRDGKTIGFTVQSEPFTQDSSRVFVVHQDGSGLAEIYQGTIISDLVFSPDNQYMLFTDRGSDTSLISVSLETMGHNKVVAQDANSGRFILLPSWQP